MVWADDLDNARPLIERALELGTMDPTYFLLLTTNSVAHLFSGRPEVAVVQAERVATLNPNFDSIYWILATCYTQLGRTAEAQAASARFMALAPDATIAKLAKGLPIRNPAHLAMVIDALRAAGMPE